MREESDIHATDIRLQEQYMFTVGGDSELFDESIAEPKEVKKISEAYKIYIEKR